MARLTDEEWQKIVPPFFVLNLTNDKFRKPQYEIICKWIEQNCGGWFYFFGVPTDRNDKAVFVFESDGDRIFFKLWITGDPFDEESMDIK